ncbi:DUF4352 domain-containing protein (plasmid) [Haladaptatus sp. SPP-AMP-3]|uniref:DUF4352 domain-containing protein n=1 Tax=Haladaptatus sp. SPP-AMP-3 TaxID=3121295 RepID=UPI003C2D8973
MTNGEQKAESTNSASEGSGPKKRDIRTLSIGETATLNGGIHVTVEEVEFKDQYVRRGSAGTPARGKQFAIVPIETRNEGEEKHELPRAITLKLKANGESYSTTSYTGSEYTRYRYRGGQSKPGAIRDGELRFEIPKSVSQSELTVQWTYTELNHPVVIRWRGN